MPLSDRPQSSNQSFPEMYSPYAAYWTDNSFLTKLVVHVNSLGAEPSKCSYFALPASSVSKTRPNLKATLNSFETNSLLPSEWARAPPRILLPLTSCKTSFSEDPSCGQLVTLILPLPRNIDNIVDALLGRFTRFFSTASGTAICPDFQASCRMI